MSTSKKETDLEQTVGVETFIGDNLKKLRLTHLRDIENP